MATLTGGTGNDSLSGAGDNDILTGAAGNDTLSGGGGADSVTGSPETATVVQGTFSWAAMGRDEASVVRGLSTTVSGMTVSVGFSQDTGKSGFSLESSDTAYVAAGETFSATSNLEISGPGSGQSTTTVNFAPVAGGGMESNVQNVAFRLNDIDFGGWQDRITVLAYDAAGNAVPVTITASGNDTVSGNMITGVATSDSFASVQGSALVQIAGPVARVEIVYSNLGTAGQIVYVSDIRFEAVRVDNDLIGGGAGDDTLTGGYGNDTLAGEDGNDRLYGGVGSDTLTGGAGDDTLAGGTQGDALDGGTGMDFADYSASTAGVSVNLASKVVSGGHAQGDTVNGIEGVIGSAFADTLVGFDQQSTVAGDVYTNVFFGGSGNDLLDGAGGNDSLYGGADRDTVYGGAGDDLVDGGSGNDLLWGGAGNDLISGAEGEDSILADAGNDTVYGGDGNDTVSGVSGSNLIHGDAGNDSIAGGSGADSLYGGSGEDVLTDTLGGANLLDGGGGNDTLAGGAGADTLYGGDGADSLSDGGGANLLDGGAGNDTLAGGAGGDALYGGLGDDSLYGGDGDDSFGAGAGDVVDGGAGNDSLDLTGAGPVRVLRDPNVAGSGTVQFLNAQRQVTGSFTYQNMETVVPCFTPGCRIATARGLVAVEALAVGDLVRVRDGDFAPLRWIGRRRLAGGELAARPELLPVRIGAGALGGGLPRRALVVSPQHRILFAGPACELLFGEPEVLVAAAHLVGMAGVERVFVEAVEYVHFMCDRHEVVKANGVWTESFQPGDMSLAGLDQAQREELFALFPELMDHSHPLRQAARPTLRAHEVAALLGRAA